MEDRQIVDLYWARSERAISESELKYGRMLLGISSALLSSDEDAMECLDDTLLAAWNSMPNDRPLYLGAYLSKIIRRISISLFRSKRAKKREGTAELTDELLECIPDTDTTEDKIERGLVREGINEFLFSLDKKKRAIFVLRYFCSRPISDIAAQTGMSEGAVKTSLSRTREGLRVFLAKRGLI